MYERRDVHGYMDMDMDIWTYGYEIRECLREHKVVPSEFRHHPRRHSGFWCLCARRVQEKTQTQTQTQTQNLNHKNF